MISKWRWLLLQITRRLWVRASLFALLGVATALLSIGAERFIPWDMPGKIGADAVDRILDILASSMLAVTTFSLSVMVAAYAAATSNGSPRATRLVMEDSTTQNVLATFVGSFLFSLVGIVTLAAGAYGDRGRVVLYVVTLAVIAVIVLTILRWIDHLSRLGRVGETVERVEKAALSAMMMRVKNPCLGGRPLRSPETDVPEGADTIYPTTIGYVQHIDAAALSKAAKAGGCSVFVLALPGTFVHAGRPLARVAASEPGAVTEDLLGELRAAFTVADRRSFDQDPRFGLIVLSEIASRALSPAINDPGTAIDVIGRAVRILGCWSERPPDEDGELAGLWIPPLVLDDLFDDVFTPIARDGAGLIEVQLRLQKGLGALRATGSEDLAAAARRQAGLALRRAEAVLTLDEDRDRLRRLVEAHEAGL